MLNSWLRPCQLPLNSRLNLSLLQCCWISYSTVKLVDADDNGVKRLILCRVILKTFEKVETVSQQCRSSIMDFDTGSDDPKNPKWYVVWSLMRTSIFYLSVLWVSNLLVNSR